MNTFRSAGYFYFCILLSMISLAGTASGEVRYLEDFTSRLHRDPLNTTALWDTVAGK